MGGTANNESTPDVSVYRAGQYFSRLGVNSAGHVYLQPGGGNVGIGTNTPAGNLHLYVPASGAPLGAMSIDIVSLNTAASASNSYFFRVRDLGGASTPFYIGGDGNVGIGTATPGVKLDVDGAIRAPGAVTGSTVSATYQDVAEWVPSSQKLSAGMVVVLDADRTNHVPALTSAYDTKVAGVVSERPGIALGGRCAPSFTTPYPGSGRPGTPRVARSDTSTTRLAA